MAIEEMAAAFFTLEQRISSFQIAHPLPGRRTSKRSSKAGAKSAAKSLKWPHKNLAPEQLAKAGFFYHPLPGSPDNTACFLCHRQIDGWEEDDEPIAEHLKHSPECAWAIIAAVEASDGAPSEELPSGKDMLNARKATFANLWPHDSKRGWKCKTKQLAEAGWYYAPTDESDDMAVCAYCHLALDGWENTDIPHDEHYKRSPDCPFFIIPAPPAKKQTKRASKARQSRLTTPVAPSPASSRGQKRQSDVFEDAPVVKRRITRNKATARPIERTPTPDPEPEPELESELQPEPEIQPELEPEPERESTPEEPTPVRHKTRTPVIARSPTPEESHTPEMSRSPTPPVEVELVQEVEASPVPPPAPAPQEFNTPTQSPQSSNAENKPPNNGLQTKNPWSAVDIDAVFATAGNNKPVKGGELSNVEKGMTVEQWIRYNAEQAEERLKAECERMVSTFENQGTRAMKALEGIECLRA